MFSTKIVALFPQLGVSITLSLNTLACGRIIQKTGVLYERHWIQSTQHPTRPLQIIYSKRKFRYNFISDMLAPSLSIFITQCQIIITMMSLAGRLP